MKHPKLDDLTAFVTGNLDAVTLDVIAAHVATCDRCCLALREIPDGAFLEHVKEAVSAPDTGDAKHYGSGQRDLSVPIELRDHPRYKLGKFLGSGGMGLVYQAEHRLMDRMVALKILRRDLLKNPRVEKRFRQEFKAAAKLSHPNIVAVYDADQAGESHFLVMEYVDGVSLHRLVQKRGPMEPAFACYCIRQAARGLEHAFEAGMVHRDIKPQNLMLTKKGQVKILDFGLARLASESQAELNKLAETTNDGEDPLQTRLGDVMGTPAYMAPEQLANASKADIRADLYALGSTLYYLLAEQPPYGAGVPRSRLLAKAKARPVPLPSLCPDLPAGLTEVVDKMMAIDPDERYQTPGEVVKALAEYAKPPSMLPPAPVKKAEEPAVIDVARNEESFLARCPFCTTRLRIPARALGASLPCPQCGCYFTSAPEDDSPFDG